MGVLGIVNTDSDGNDTGFGRFETKRLWQYKVDIAASYSGTTLETLLATAGIKGSLSIAAKTVGRPTVTFNEIEVNHGNESWKLAGKTSWASEAIEMVFNDIIPASNVSAGETDPQYSVASIFYEWLNLIQSNLTGAAGLSKDYKADIIVTQFNPAGLAVERLLYHGAWPNSVSGDPWDYTAEEGSTITSSMTFDKYYRLETSGTGTNPPGELFGTVDELTTST